MPISEILNVETSINNDQLTIEFQQFIDTKVHKFKHVYTIKCLIINKKKNLQKPFKKIFLVEFFNGSLIQIKRNLEN